MTGDHMGDLMSDHDSKRFLCLCHRKQTGIDHHLATRHGECVHAVLFHQLELPGIVFQLRLIAVIGVEGLHRFGDAAPDAGDHLCIGSAAFQWCSTDELLVLLQT